MLIFSDWIIKTDGDLIARQYDNLTRELLVMGTLPEGWAWELLVQAGGSVNVIALSPRKGGVGVTLTAEMLTKAGLYALQLRGGRGEEVRHTNVIQVVVPTSLVGDATWPELPSEFSQAETNIRALNAHPPYPGENGYWMTWDLDAHSYAESDIPLPEVDVGPPGPPGEAATVTVGGTTTGEPGTQAQVTNSGTESAAVLNFVVPRGATGATPQIRVRVTQLPEGAEPTVEVTGTAEAPVITLGIPAGATGGQGPQGPAGQTPTITIGQVETLPPGSPVTATITGQTPNLVLNLGIPQGAQGTPGEAGTIEVTETQTVPAGTPASFEEAEGSTAQARRYIAKVPQGAGGPQGPEGQAATVTVGTVTTGAPGTDAAVTNSGTAQAAVLDFTLPRGEPGSGGTAEAVSGAGFTLTFGKRGADLTATVTYDQGEATLDTVAYNGKTYREMFMTANVLPEGDFESGLDQLRVNAGEPAIVEEAYDSPGHGLKCFGASSQQLIATLSQAELGTHYVAVRARLDRYGSGGGIGLQVPVGNDLTTKEPTDGAFVTLSDLRTVGPASALYAGSIRSADLDGYIDDIVVVPVSVFGDLEKEEIDGLYEAYLKIRRGEPIPSAPPETLVLETRSTTSEAEHTDTECVARFMEAVSEKASALGMTSSTFTRPAGDGGNMTTARDLMRMLVEAAGYKEIARIWGKDTRAIPVLGANARTVTVNTTVTDPDLEGAYHIFGGKTGSWAGTEDLVIVAETESHGMVAGVVMDATSGAARFDAMKELLDVVDGKGTEVTSAVSAIACAVPAGNVFQYEGYPFPVLYEQNADTETIPASVTKVLTAMVALDHTPDIHETVEFRASDAIGGSGAVFQTGDIVTVEDALYAMLLPSSNMAAQAVARTVGRKLLEREEGG